MKTLDLKKKKFIGRKEVIVIFSAIVLTTVGIKASDQFLNKSGAEVNTGEKGCPSDMVNVISAGGDFCMDKYEASAGNGCPNGIPGNQEQTKANIDAVRCKAASTPDSIPWANISQNQAMIACAKAGKRLPTNKEWLAASLGTPDKNGGWNPDDCQVANNWETQPGLAGSGKNCVSSAGIYDMVGNVWEWVAGTIADGAYDGRALPKKGYVKGVDENALPSETDQAQGDSNYNNDYMFIVDIGTRAFARGGYWNNQADAGQYSVYLESPPSFAGPGVGFRCAK